MTLRERIGEATDRALFVGFLVGGMALIVAREFVRRRRTQVDAGLVRKADVSDPS